jgi:tripartite-type tricarboxylate transporter receptor subunit TctC
LRFVPYRAGASEIIKDLAGGHIDLTFEQAISGLNSVRSGIVKAYAVTASARLAAAPDIPTIDEAGAPGVHISTWSGLLAPKGTPKPAIAKLTSAAMAALADPVIAARLADLGQAIPPPAQQTAEALRAFHKAEIEKWWPIIKGGTSRPSRPSSALHVLSPTSPHAPTARGESRVRAEALSRPGCCASALTQRCVPPVARAISA